jgi:hypothetical protein
MSRVISRSFSAAAAKAVSTIKSLKCGILITEILLILFYFSLSLLVLSRDIMICKTM